MAAAAPAIQPRQLELPPSFSPGRDLNAAASAFNGLLGHVGVAPETNINIDKFHRRQEFPVSFGPEGIEVHSPEGTEVDVGNHGIDVDGPTGTVALEPGAEDRSAGERTEGEGDTGAQTSLVDVDEVGQHVVVDAKEGVEVNGYNGVRIPGIGGCGKVPGNYKGFQLYGFGCGAPPNSGN